MRNSKNNISTTDFIPPHSLFRAEQLAIAQKMEDRQANTPGRSKVKRRGST